jgi:hypothetical protein
MRTWKVLKFGPVPENAAKVEFECPGCEEVALLPVVGHPLAQVGGGIVFDPGRYAIPQEIQCRVCRRRFTTDKEGVA